MAAPSEETEIFRIARPAAADAPALPQVREAFGLEIQTAKGDDCSDSADRTLTEISVGKLAPIADPSRMRDAGYCKASDIERLWKQKTRLDVLFDQGESALYWRSREALYPTGRRGSDRPLGNRAGEKLEEIARVVGGLEDALQKTPKENAFLDICGAPGAWSQYLLQVGSEHGALMRGFGFSLRNGTNPRTCTWYEALASRSDFHTIWGADDTGNVCTIENIAQAVEAIGRKVLIAVADGGDGTAKSEDGQHMENYQEIVNSRILLAEVLLMLKTIQLGGMFVCKILDTFSHMTCSLIFTVSCLFEETFIVKPRHSRVVNSERYLVGKRCSSQPGMEIFDILHAAVAAAHAAWPQPGPQGPWSGSAPVSVVPQNLLLADEPFCSSIRAMSTALCDRQARALEAVIDHAEALRNGGTAVIGCPPAKRRRRGST
mmetsp:Transcript_56444/g.101183  ORF Transcript_56444/g.101183 Transcript_56444/m.101183 type:complete len:433 (+) Transcript_56444:64-1362(+)